MTIKTFLFTALALFILCDFPCFAQQSTFSIPRSYEFPSDFQNLEIQLYPTVLSSIDNNWAIAYADSVDSAECSDCDWKSYGYGIATNIPILVEATKSQNATIVSQQETIDILIDQLLLLQEQVTTLINNGE